MLAAAYLRDGFKLAFAPGIRLYVFLPLLINAVLFGFLLRWGFHQTELWQQQLTAAVPSWLEWLQWLIKPAFYITAALVLFYGFSSLANFVAAPFNGLLSERVEAFLDPTLETKPVSVLTILTSIPAALLRECQKILYYLPRAMLIFALGFVVPGVNLVLWLVFNAWMMNLQYLDLPMDNNGQSFTQVKRRAWAHKRDSASFGGAVMLLTMVPIVNLLIMPAAVCGATKMWVYQNADR